MLASRRCTDDDDAVVAALEERDLLLVLDNCEHLVDACAELTQKLLRACAGLRILATSREPLGVDGEVRWIVPSLVLPREHDAGSTEDVEAVRLFVERARAAHSAFALLDRDAATVAEICRAVDGIPLALELAAAWVRVLPVGPDRREIEG